MSYQCQECDGQCSIYSEELQDDGTILVTWTCDECGCDWEETEDRRPGIQVLFG